MSERTAIELSRPIELQNETIAEVSLHEPDMGDMEAYDLADGQVAKSIHLIAKLSGHSAGVIRKMAPRDFAKCTAYVAPFMAEFARDEDDDLGEGAADAD